MRKDKEPTLNEQRLAECILATRAFKVVADALGRANMAAAALIVHLANSREERAARKKGEG